jgi:hypothetical protein
MTRAHLVALTLALASAIGLGGCRLIAGIHDIELEADAGVHKDAGADVKSDRPTDGPAAEREAGSSPCACTNCTVLANEQDLPLTIQMSGDTLYWLDFGSAKGAASLMSMPKTGGTPKQLAGNMTQAYGLQIDATTLYWAAVDTSGAGTIVSMPLAGGAVTTLVNGLPAPTSNFISGGVVNVPSEQFLAVSDTTLYFIMFDPCGDQGFVGQVPKKGGLETNFLSNLPMEGGSDEVQAYAITLSGESLFVANNNTTLDVILQAPLSGGPATIAIPDLTYPLALDVDGSNILWCDDEADFTNAFVRSAPIGGSPVTTLAKGLSGPWGVITDATDAYFITNYAGNGTVQKAPIDGSSAAVVLVPDALAPQAVIMDDQFLYWVDSQCGGVLKTPK